MTTSWVWLTLGLLAVPEAEAGPKTVDARLVIERFASEPEIVTPTGIAVDERGRVFVVECHTHYRLPSYNGPLTDRIRVFEDRDGDGRPDRVWTFFEGTVATMSMIIDRDGSVVLVTRNEVLRLRDRDGDGRADERRSIVWLATDRGADGLAHDGLEGLALDFAGNVYFSLGKNNGFTYRLVAADGATFTGGGEGGNIFRCRPDGTGLTRVATGLWNAFGLAFDVYGMLVAGDNDPYTRSGCRLLHVVEQGDYGYRYRHGLQGLHPFSSWDGEVAGTLPMAALTGEAPAAVVVYESDNLPSDYRGDLLVTAWGDHRVDRFRLHTRAHPSVRKPSRS